MVCAVKGLMGKSLKCLPLSRSYGCDLTVKQTFNLITKLLYGFYYNVTHCSPATSTGWCHDTVGPEHPREFIFLQLLSHSVWVKPDCDLRLQFFRVLFREVTHVQCIRVKATQTQCHAMCVQITEHMGKATFSMCSAMHLIVKVDLHIIRAD